MPLHVDHVVREFISDHPYLETRAVRLGNLDRPRICRDGFRRIDSGKARQKCRGQTSQYLSPMIHVSLFPLVNDSANLIIFSLKSKARAKHSHKHSPRRAPPDIR